MRNGLLLAAALVAGPGSTAEAQDLAMSGARWITTPHTADYRLGFSRYRLGPVAFATFGQLVFQGPRTEGHLLAGAGADALLPLDAGARPYLLGGVSGGFLDLRSGAGLALWHGWSGGAGWELVRGAGMALSVEARYQWISRARVGGLSIGGRIGRPLGQARAGSRRNPAPSDRPGPAPDRSPTPERGDGPVALGAIGRGNRAEVTTALEAALSAMGTPYQWGGTDQNGFDCSGLIQFAYARAGIAVPRRSADQALAGREVGTAVAGLAPGDILTFSRNRSSAITHVGLYLGNGRFIHSASNGVIISSLDPDDLTARWWLDRWVGTRRLID